MSQSCDGGPDELDVNCSNWDILQEIDKFLESYSSNDEELPVKNNNNELDVRELPVHSKKNELCISKKIKEINTSNFVVENIKKSNDVEFIGKNPATFELLEDNEEYAVYEHNPDEANWNVFYKTLPPGEQHHIIKTEPGTEDVNGNFGQYISESKPNFEIELKSTFRLQNIPTQNIQPFNIKPEPLDTEASTLNETNAPLHFDEAFNFQEDTLSKEKCVETFLNSSSTSYDTSANNILENFSFLSSFDSQESNLSKNHPIPNEIFIQNQETIISGRNSHSDFLSSSATQESILKSKIELEKFSFSLDNINKIQTQNIQPFNIKPEPLDTEASTLNETQNIQPFNIKPENFSFSLDNINKIQNPIYVQPENLNLQSKDNIKSKNDKTWAQFKQYNCSDSRDKHQNLVHDFQYDSKHKKKLFKPQQFKKHFNKFQPDRSRHSKQPINNTLWKRHNNFSQNKNNRIESFKNKSTNCEPNYTKKYAAKPINKFQLPPVPIKSTSHKSWNFPVLSTQHDYDNSETQNIDEKNLNDLSLTIPNENHTYKHGYTAAKPFMNNSTPELLALNWPSSFDKIGNKISKKDSGMRDYSNTHFNNFCTNLNKSFNNGKIGENKKEALIIKEILDSPKNINNTREVNFNKSQYIIRDYLSPESLVGCTVKFTSRKLANTITRDQLIEALATYGKIENSWWTPDDYFFATYTSRKVANHVFNIFPKNLSSSY